MLRRLSILGSLLLAACVPAGYNVPPGSAASCYTRPPTQAEAGAWRNARQVNTARAYRDFINAYPRSCYVPAATEKLSALAQRKPVVVRNVPKSPKPKPGGGLKPY